MIEGIKHLGESSRGVILHHLLALDAEDRYARFGSLIRDEGIRALVARLDFERDLLLGIEDSSHLVGLAHIGRSQGVLAELSLSVAAHWRYQGIARTLFECAARNVTSQGIANFACIHGHPATLRIANKLNLPYSFQTVDPRVIIKITIS